MKTIDPVVSELIAHERDRQNQKWGTIQTHGHEVGTWIAIAESKLHDARMAYTGSRGDNSAKAEIIKVIAVLTACLEQHGGPDDDYRSELSPRDEIEALKQRCDQLSRMIQRPGDFAFSEL